MDDDLDTPRAVAEMWGLMKAANNALDAGDTARAAPLVAAMREMAAAFGLSLQGSTEEIPSEVAELVTARDKARAERDYAGADHLRGQLESLGWVVEDTAQGTRVHRKDT